MNKVVNIDRWIKRITWTSCFLFLIILLITITEFVYYRFYHYPISEEILRYLKAEEVLYMGDSFISPYGIYNISPNNIYNSPILDYIGKTIVILCICFLITLWLRETWHERKHSGSISG